MQKIILSFVLGAVSVASIFFVLNSTHQAMYLPDAILPDSGKYQGDMLNDMFHGKGEIIWEDNSFYEGQFDRGLFHGQGYLQMTDGSVYEGEFTHGAITGTGVITYPDELPTKYSGEFENGLAHGTGKLELEDHIYEGEFRNNKYHGQGTQSFNNGVVYSGEFENNQFHGQGSYVMEDGQSYIGEFIEGNFSGEGEYTNSDGLHYVGYFKDWMYHGKGELKTANGDRYIGDFEYGQLMGDGEHIGIDGTHYKGEFNYGQYHGQGSLSYPEPIDGVKTVTGQFKYGRLMESGDVPHLKGPELNNEITLYNQESLLENAWASLENNDSEKIDLYFLGVAGDGKQAVFRREVQFVQDYFDKTFNTRGKSLSLINDKQTIESHPLATRKSINRTLSAMAEHMNPEQDILFVYLSSHGSSDFEFSLDQSELSLPNLSSKEFSNMLKKLEIKWKVLVISACYSGGFIPDLEDEHTLIITAAADDKQSFGCDDKNDFTYFGEAYFKDALPLDNNFITAFYKAKEIVSEREKSQNYDQSNPQISRPTAIEQYLEKWMEENLGL